MNKTNNGKTVYVVRLVGGAAVIRMPKHTVGKHFTQTEGKNGVIYMTPYKDESKRLKEDSAVSNLALATQGL